MNRIIFFLIVLLFSAKNAMGQKDISLSRPKLVVGVVIDQMRWDYLYRYYDKYQNNGFKRILSEGFSCESTYINYIPSFTAVGHSAIYTGSIPAIHGITGNYFINKKNGERQYCTADSTVTTVGGKGNAGKMSPTNLLSTTITDELKLGTNFRSKVIGISLKDRGAILPAGHSADAAYWFDDSSGNWITSTWYMDHLPTWVEEFNNKNLTEKYLSEEWGTLYPKNQYFQSTADNNKYEGKLHGQKKPVLPIKLSSLDSKNSGVLRYTPYGNSLVLEFAKTAIQKENLGMDNIPDFLTISFSSTDYIGHRFGINSIEIEDTYLRMDRLLASLFEFLDKSIGKGNYTLFITADHGAAHNANFLKDNKIPSGLWDSEGTTLELNSILEKEFHKTNLIISMLNYQVHLNNKLIRDNDLDKEAIKKTCRNFLKCQEAIEYVVDIENEQIKDVPEVIKKKIINGIFPAHSGELQIILKPQWYDEKSHAKGSTHGSWNPYDAHIPLLWMGWGINQGKSYKKHSITDIAPTLGALLKIQVPNGNIGKAIPEVLKN